MSIVEFSDVKEFFGISRFVSFNGTRLIIAVLIYLALCLPLIYLTNAPERRLNHLTS